ncbi:MAG TPA: hypothetical protein VKR31_07250 [Rhizomicrobium sp.]|nr:hypothetical protein [Rhizomicrobium sp.]
MKTQFATAAAILALAMSGGFVNPAHAAGGSYVVLWNQNANFGNGVNSQTYQSSKSAYDDVAADDFIVPNGETWRISEVDVTGAYVGRHQGPASSVQISIYAGPKWHPKRILKSYTVSCTDNDGSFQCVLPTKKRGNPALKLNSGHYWLSVVANCRSKICGQWKWTENTSVTDYEGVWENPANGWKTACLGWDLIRGCFGGNPVDLAFDLIGTSTPSK